MTAPTPAEQGRITRDMLVLLRAVLWYDCDTTDEVARGLADAPGVLHCLGHQYIIACRQNGMTDEEIAEALAEFARLAGLQDLDGGT